MFSIQESTLFAFWTALCAVYEESALHRFLAAAGRWCNRQIDSSRILAVLCREGAVARAWDGSLTCRGLSFLVNLPGNLLHRLYTAFSRQFDQSMFASLAFAMGHETAIGESWVIMALWVIPFERWNNAYNLLGFAALLLLFYAGSMRRYETFRLDVKSVGPYATGMFLAVVLGVVLSAYPSLSARFLMYHTVCLLCVLVTVSAVRNAGDLKRLAAGGSVVVLVSSLYAVYQRIQGVEINKSYVDLDANAGMPGRVESFFDNPNTFAQVLILLLPIVLGLMLCAKRPIFKLIAAGIFVVGAWRFLCCQAAFSTAFCPLPIPRTVPPPAVFPSIRRPSPRLNGLPSPARDWALPLCRRLSRRTTSTTRRPPLSMPTIFICRFGLRRDCWGLCPLWGQCC